MFCVDLDLQFSNPLKGLNQTISFINHFLKCYDFIQEKKGETKNYTISDFPNPNQHTTNMKTTITVETNPTAIPIPNETIKKIFCVNYFFSQTTMAKLR